MLILDVFGQERSNVALRAGRIEERPGFRGRRFGSICCAAPFSWSSGSLWLCEFWFKRNRKPSALARRHRNIPVTGLLHSRLFRRQRRVVRIHFVILCPQNICFRDDRCYRYPAAWESCRRWSARTGGGIGFIRMGNRDIPSGQGLPKPSKRES